MSEEVAVAVTEGGEGRERFFDVPYEDNVERRDERASSEEKEAKRRRVDTESEGVSEELKEIKGHLSILIAAVGKLEGTLTEMIGRMDRQEERFGEMERNIVRQGEEIEKVKDKVEKSAKELCDVKEAVKRSAETVKQTKEGVDEWKERVRHLEERLIDSECRSRRNNLIFFSVQESGSQEGDRKLVEDVIKKCGVTENVILERVHRLPPGPRRAGIGTGALKPRPLIVRFLDYNQREMVRRSRKHLPPGITMSEDFPLEVREARKKLIPELQELKRNGIDAWINYPARLMVQGQEKKSVRPSVDANRRNRD